MSPNGTRNLCYMIIIFMMCMTLANSTFLDEHCVSEGVSCLNCTHRKMCVRYIPFFGPIVRHGNPQPCSDSMTGQSQPYCDPETNQCVSYVPAQCNAEGSLTCLREEEGNNYPDIRDCKKYYECGGESPIVQQCPNGMVYRQSWRKCVVNLNTERDCFKVTTCPASGEVYPGDVSLYYKCAQGNSQVALTACQSSLEEFDTTSQTCRTNSLCEGAPSKLLPVPYACEAYYDCSTKTKMLCPSGQGFNQRTEKCTPFYNNLCNELALFENNLKSFFGGFFLYEIIDNLLNFVNISPYSLILLLPIPEQIITTEILVLDYLYKERSIPPGLIGYLVEFGLSLIPPPIRMIIDMLLNLLPFKLPTGNNLSKDAAIALAIEHEFVRTNFTEVAENVRQVESVPVGFQSFVKHVAGRLNIPQENLYGILQFVSPALSTTVNNLLGGGAKVLVVENKELHFNEKGLWEILQGQVENIANSLKWLNNDFSGVFRHIVNVFDKEEYQFVENVAKEIYFPLHV